MKIIKYFILLLVMAASISSCEVRREGWVQGHYGWDAYGHRYWVPGHYN